MGTISTDHFVKCRPFYSIFLAIFLLLMPTLLFAQDGATRKLTPDNNRIDKTLEQKAIDLGQNLRKKTVRLINQLTDPPRQTYPFHIRPVSPTQSFDFESHVRPILDKKCVACHSCYEAPCQLNLTHPQGIERGASKIRVYDGLRLRDIAPTRLHIDSQTTAGWRKKGFFSVLDPIKAEDGTLDRSLMLKTLELGRSLPLAADEPVSNKVDLGLERFNSCPAPGEFSSYSAANVHGGMPLAVAGLSDGEFRTVSTWLQEGAKIHTTSPDLSVDEVSFTRQVDAWFNRQDNRSKLVARYLYEHLFLAHLYLKKPEPDETPRFFQIIRSLTPPGQPAVSLTTVRPNAPPRRPFYYRIVPITERIVHKTHITYRFDKARLSSLENLFFQSNWSVSELPDYREEFRANPFITFKSIPAKSRYQFLLNDAEFFVRNFIRGPVCNGQIATYVIRDQFWVMFEDPDVEHYVNNPAYQKLVNSQLGVPGQNTSLIALGPEWIGYQSRRNEYLDNRREAYTKQFPEGPHIRHIWDGDSDNDNAFLTVFRHHTNASVTRGWHGEYPLTGWIMDYPLIERTFYELVVGFDVFASVSHQVQTRLYFDLIRNEGETNFLRFLPPASRRSVYESWYQADAKVKSLIIYHELDTRSPSAVPLTTDRPTEEMYKTVQLEFPGTTQSPDVINGCRPDCGTKDPEPIRNQVNSILQTLAARPAKNLSGIRWLPEVSFLRVDLPNGTFLAYTILRNRRHSNVSFIFGESLRRQEDLDSLTLVPTLIGSYPNIIFQVNLSDIERFRDVLASVNSNSDYKNLISRWGVLRMAPNFWDIFHSFTQYVRKHDPLEAGIYDMNRYGKW